MITKALLLSAIHEEDRTTANALLAVMCLELTQDSETARYNFGRVLGGYEELTPNQRQATTLSFLKASFGEERFDGLVAKGRAIVKQSKLIPA